MQTNIHALVRSAPEASRKRSSPHRGLPGCQVASSLKSLVTQEEKPAVSRIPPVRNNYSIYFEPEMSNSSWRPRRALWITKSKGFSPSGPQVPALNFQRIPSNNWNIFYLKRGCAPLLKTSTETCQSIYNPHMVHRTEDTDGKRGGEMDYDAGGGLGSFFFFKNFSIPFSLHFENLSPLEYIVTDRNSNYHRCTSSWIKNKTRKGKKKKLFPLFFCQVHSLLFYTVTLIQQPVSWQSGVNRSEQLIGRVSDLVANHTY